jgi:hypothetical protein
VYGTIARRYGYIAQQYLIALYWQQGQRAATLALLETLRQTMPEANFLIQFAFHLEDAQLHNLADQGVPHCAVAYMRNGYAEAMLALCSRRCVSPPRTPAPTVPWLPCVSNHNSTAWPGNMPSRPRTWALLCSPYSRRYDANGNKSPSASVPLTRHALQFLLASIKKIDIMAYISPFWAYAWKVLRDIYESRL